MALLGTVKEADSLPADKDAHANEVETMSVGVEVSTVIVPQLSAVSNPLPVIVTAVLIGPEIGLSVILGPVTVKVPEAASVVVPVTVIVWAPMYGNAVSLTVKEPLIDPPAVNVHVPPLTMVGRGVLVIHE